MPSRRLHASAITPNFSSDTPKNGADNNSDGVNALGGSPVAGHAPEMTPLSGRVVQWFLNLSDLRLSLYMTFIAALIAASIWGLVLLTILSYEIARSKRSNPYREILYHLIIAVIVIIGSKYMGNFIAAILAGNQ